MRVRRYSSDGDPRLLRAMMIGTKIGQRDDPSDLVRNRLTNEDLDLASVLELNKVIGKILKVSPSEIFPKEIFVQDTVHILNILKNRLLDFKPVISLLGNYVANAAHIQGMYNQTSRSQHQLTKNDVKITGKIDKMNFQLKMRFFHPRICLLLQDKVPQSAGRVHV